MDKYFDNTPILKAIFKFKWHIIAITIIAAVLGAFFSGPKFITPKYKSEAIVYPNGRSEFSDETFTEQMLQVMESQEILDSVAEVFDLMSHYKIDKNYQFAKTALIGEYRDRVSISKTPYDAVKIKVLDKDPEIACAMVNEIIRLYNVKFSEIHKNKKWENARMYEKNLARKYNFIDSLKRDLAQIANNGNMINYLYLSKGNSIAYFSEGENNNAEDIANAIALVELIASETAAYSEIKIEYEREIRQADGDITYLNVVSKPFVAEKKSYPVRWIIVALCGISAFLLSVLTVISIETFFVKE
jgi:capsular polysaccharide biosynthesis protein